MTDGFNVSSKKITFSDNFAELKSEKSDNVKEKANSVFEKETELKHSIRSLRELLSKMAEDGIITQEHKVELFKKLQNAKMAVNGEIIQEENTLNKELVPKETYEKIVKYMKKYGIPEGGLKALEPEEVGLIKTVDYIKNPSDKKINFEG